MSLTPAGWVIMVLSMGTVLSLAAFSLYKVLTLPPVDVEEHLKAPPDIDTGDTDEPD